MKICTAQQMRNIDRHASEIGGIPSIVLMENAALACVAEIEKLCPERVGIFCGKGNNGGDGFAIARHLYNKGIDTEVFLVCGSDFSGDALINYEIIEKMGVKITEITDTSLLEYYIMSKDLTVDAIFGTGIKGEITGIAAEVIDAINLYSKKILSVDIPSGVNSDTGDVAEFTVTADITVTFAAYKRGMILFPGADYTGKITVSDISIPQYIINDNNIELNLIDDKIISQLMPIRYNNSQKGDYGKVFITGGSIGMTGAPCLSAEAALNSGAGLVTVGIPKSLNPITEVKLTEAMTLPLLDNNGDISSEAYTQIKSKMSASDVLLFGPGIGRHDDCRDLLADILSESRIPVIVDADGLFALSGHLDMLNFCSCNLIFTPHEVEFARLLEIPLEEVIKNRLELSKNFAIENGVTLVLKGHHTIVTSPAGIQYVNNTGNPGMATGGSGDVLAGMIAAFVGMGLDETEAAILGVYLHGKAGDMVAAEYGETPITATDICKFIKKCFYKLPLEKTHNL